MIAEPQLQLDPAWFVYLFEFPFWFSFMITTIIAIIFLFATKSFKIYKFPRIVLTCLAIPVAGIISLLIPLAIIALGNLYFLFFLIPIISIVLFFIAAWFINKTGYKYMDDQVIFILSALIALLGNPVIMFMWGYKEMWLFPQ